MKNQNKAYIYAILAVLFWSTVASAFKISLRHVNHLQMLFYASLTSLLTLFLILLIQGKFKKLINLKFKEIILSLAFGIINPVLYYIFLFKAYSLVPAQEALALNWLWPITLVLLSIPVLKQKITMRDILATFISFSGVFVIITKGNFSDLKFQDSTGVICALITTIIWAFFWIYNTRDKNDEVIKLFLNFTSGTVIIMITLLVFDEFTIPSLTGFYAVMYVGIFEMGITFLFWLMALSLTETTAKISNIVYISPFLSLFWINIIVGEEINYTTIIGMVLIISGIVINKVSKKGKST